MINTSSIHNLERNGTVSGTWHISRARNFIMEPQAKMLPVQRQTPTNVASSIGLDMESLGEGY